MFISLSVVASLLVCVFFIWNHLWHQYVVSSEGQASFGLWCDWAVVVLASQAETRWVGPVCHPAGGSQESGSLEPQQGWKKIPDYSGVL